MTKEQDGQPSAAANLDTDDGVTFPTYLEASSSQDLPAYVDVTASAAGKLDVWLDRIGAGFGVFESSEHLNGGVSYSVIAGLNRINFTIPAGTTLGDTVMRFRLSSAGSLAPTGRADDGEVEDYAVSITTPQAPVTPAITGPASVTTDIAPTVTWTLHPENYNYDVVVTNSVGDVVFSRTGTTFNYAQIVPPLPGGTVYPLPAGIYTETVRAYNKEGLASSVATRQFEIIPPVITAPTGSVASVRPQIVWDAVNNAATYSVQLFNVTDNTLVSTVSGIAATNWTPAADLVLAEYEARVTAFNSAMQGSSVGVRRFTVAPAPVAVTPSGRLPDSTPSFGWSGVPGADQYELIVREEFGAGSIVISQTGLTTTTFTQPTELPLGRYSYTIRAINNPSNGSLSSSAYSNQSLVGQFTITERPTVVNPPATTFLTRPEFSWTVPLGAGNDPVSDIWVNKIENGVGRVFLRANGVTGTTWTANADFGLGTYHVYVRTYSATDPGTISDYSFPKTVRVTTAPTPLTPGGRTDTTRPALTWEGVLGAKSYRVYLASLSAGGRVILDITNINALSFTLPQSLVLGRYRYWVMASSAFGENSGWSLAKDFQVVAAPVVSGVSSSTFDNTPTFNWTSLSGFINGNIPAGATSYDVRIDQVLPTSVVTGFRSATVTGTTYTVPDNLALPTNYIYRAYVRARSADTQGDFSVKLEFFVGGRPNLNAIPTGSSQRPTLSWGVVDGASSYEIFLVNLADPSKIVARVSSIVLNSYTPTTNIGTGAFRYWARAFNSANGSPSLWSVPVDFVVAENSSPQPSGIENSPWILTAASSVLENQFSEISVSMLPSRSGSARSIEQEWAVAAPEVSSNSGAEQSAGAAPAVPAAADVPADTDAVLSGWSQEAWWDEAQPGQPGTALPAIAVAAEPAASKPQPKSASLGLLGSLLGLASLRRRRRDEES